MQAITQNHAFLGTRAGSTAGSRGALWTGRVLNAIAVLLYVALFVSGGLFVREARLHALLPRRLHH